MNPPAFTVLIGSICRPVLKFSLESIQRQSRVEGDQCLIGIDAFEQGPREDIQQMVASYGPGFLAVPYNAGYHWLGVEQINNLLRNVPIAGDYLFTIGDDDVFVDGAYEELRKICVQYPDRPILYRFIAPNRWVLWDIPRLAPCLISGCCIAAPRKFSPLMHTRKETTHDYDWIVEILRNANEAGKPPIWLDYIGVIARPNQIGSDVDHAARYPARIVEECEAHLPNAYV